MIPFPFGVKLSIICQSMSSNNSFNIWGHNAFGKVANLLPYQRYYEGTPKYSIERQEAFDWDEPVWKGSEGIARKVSQAMIPI